MITSSDLTSFIDRYFFYDPFIQRLILASKEEISKNFEQMDENNVVDDRHLKYVSEVGNKIVSELRKEFRRTFNVVYAVDEMMPYVNTVMLYATCLVDKIGPDCIYSVSFEFNDDDNYNMFCKYKGQLPAT